MSWIGIRDSDGKGQSRDGNAIQHPTSFRYETVEVNGRQIKRRSQRGQPQIKEEETPESTKAFMCMPSGCPDGDSDGKGQSRDGNVIQHPTSFRYENVVNGRQIKRRLQRGQLQIKEEETPESTKEFICMTTGCPDGDSDGKGQSRDGSAIQHPTTFRYENIEVNGRQIKRRSQRGQPLKKEEETPESTRAFMCMEPGCPRTFSSRFKLLRHILIHSGERPFECSSCGRRFHRKDHLKNHVQVHNPDKVFHSCELCSKRYCSLLSYRKHIAYHAAEAGDLVCKLCGKIFENREGILHHLKVHTGSRTLRGPSERKFPCNLCDRSFFTKKDVKRHLVVHTGKRDFVCRFCPQRFGRKDHLVRHTKKSHDKNANVNFNNSQPPTEPLRKYDTQMDTQMPPPQMPPVENNHKNGSFMGPQPLFDIPGLVISPTTVTRIIDNLELDPIKPDPSYGMPPPSNLVQSNYINSIPSENGQNVGRYSETPLLPVSQYLPMSPAYPTVSPMTPHHYLNMSTSSNILSDLLPPMSIAPSFSNSLSLDVGNPPLPHFNQAFQ